MNVRKNQRMVSKVCNSSYINLFSKFAVHKFCLKHKLIKIQSFKISKAKKYNKET